MDKKELNAKRLKKLRYKKNTKKDSHDTKEADKAEKKKPVEDFLPSNWAKYEINEESDEEISEAADFKTLLDEPLSQGSYFKFKNEANWSNNVEFHSQFQKYFTVDINLLNLGVTCVPFSQRHGFDSPVLNTLNEDIEKNLVKYQNYLNKKYPESNHRHVEKIKEEPKEISVSNCKKPEDKSDIETEMSEMHITCNKIDLTKITKKNIVLSSETNEIDEDLDILLKSEKQETKEPEIQNFIDDDPLMETAPTVTKNVISHATEDLEQWLDDILDD